ncbi:hypothetical protein DS745_04175 [Anaerobacillus alkaliphilus]|uniref:Phosphotyrosine protein phosphatase I domain-containing protein n=1 Tax=Anaerobacillus alkaliphilus TaxID=1548597 RepID=A0A4Q0VXX0_9BACI|nr:GrpB family protein [Anaerobacillus alkaliphilus]RXJ04587.1 hypothetical protein DS745_04175 [Anaerobacillus alkaliphilus]
MKVLFVCTDNFTRSVTAEFCFKEYLSRSGITNIEVASAGFKANSDLSKFSSVHFDRMRELEIDTSSFTRTQFQQGFLNEYVIVAMGKEHRDYILQEFGERVYLFNEVYCDEEKSVVVPPPDYEGKYLDEIRQMVDYLHKAMPTFYLGLLRRENGVIIEEYNPDWAISFSSIKKIIEAELGELAVEVEHVGSTSVEGLSAKPIIDIDVVIEDRSLLPKVIKKLANLGYIHNGDQGIPGREAFKRVDQYVPRSENNAEWMAQHLYVCTKDNVEIKRHLAFRDYLRQNQEAVIEYESLKKHLAKTASDREAYTLGKGNFVEAILRKVK